MKKLITLSLMLILVAGGMAGIEPKLLLAGHSALTLGFGYRGTGPLRTDLAKSGELNGFWGRMGYSYRF